MRPADHRGHDGTGTPATGWAVRFITSVKLAVALIAYLVVASIASTLVPGWGTRFFTSIAFLLPSAAFFANLTACTIRRFVRELRRPSRRRHGPDVLHLGLIVLVVGAVISYQGKRAGMVSLAPGESATLPDGATLTVTDFRFDRYSDGRPKDWVSTVRIEREGQVVLDGFELRVNRPLRRAGTSYYQSSYDEELQLVLRDDAGTVRVLRAGEQAAIGGTVVAYMAPETSDGKPTGRAIVSVGQNEKASVQRVAAGDPLGPTVGVAEIRSVLLTGIEAVRDPGWPVVAAALALIAIGTALTFLQKLREVS